MGVSCKLPAKVLPTGLGAVDFITKYDFILEMYNSILIILPDISVVFQ